MKGCWKDGAIELKRGQTPAGRVCEIIGDLATYLVLCLYLLSDCQNCQVNVSWRLSEQVDVTSFLVLAYMHAHGFKTPTREFSQFNRNLN